MCDLRPRPYNQRGRAECRTNLQKYAEGFKARFRTVAEYPAFPLWTDAYLSDTTHLTTIEHGAYLLLLLSMWRAGGSLPNDDHRLARFAKMGDGQWTRIRSTMMEFFTVEGDRLVQNRLTDELAFVRQRSARQSDNARAKSRKYNKTSFATAEPNSSQKPAPTPTPISNKNQPSVDTPPASKTKGTRLSNEWVLPKSYGEWALAQALPRERILIEAEKMKNWSINAGRLGVKKDWFAAWKNWVQKAIDDLPRARGSPGIRPKSGLAALTEEFRQELAEDGYGDQGQEGRDTQDDARFPLLTGSDHR